MKKISLIFLSLVFVFAVGCSASKNDSAFLDKVKDKNVVVDATEVVVGSFSDDGKKYTPNGSSVGYTFDKASSETEANYLVAGVAGTDSAFVVDGENLKIIGITVGTLKAK